jgi:hypothetical protein
LLPNAISHEPHRPSAGENVTGPDVDTDATDVPAWSDVAAFSKLTVKRICGAGRPGDGDLGDAFSIDLTKGRPSAAHFDVGSVRLAVHRFTRG